MANIIIHSCHGEYFAYDSEYIEHHGVLGQKWGVRRYQNYDGSLTSAGKKKYSANEQDTKVTKTVKKDLANLSGKDFQKKYHVSNTTYMKRIDKYGDPYKRRMEPVVKVAQKGINKEAKKAEKKNAALQKDIDSFKGHEKGIYTKDGKMLLSSEDVQKSVNSLKEQQRKNEQKVKDMIRKVSSNTTVTRNKETGEYVLKLK